MTSVLPPLYDQWMTELLGATVAGEPRATCASCAMVQPPDAPPLEHAFHPGTKCCTYLPDLSNFLVGAILSDTDAQGAPSRANLRDRIASRIRVTPLGIFPPPVYATLYDAGRSAFGRSLLMRCPHYVADGGLCGVWRHREAVCTTWFCKFERGPAGRTFWRVLLLTLQAIERALRMWAVGRVGLTDEALAEVWAVDVGGTGRGLDVNALNNAIDSAAYARAWGPFAGREAELYARTAELVGALGWDQVLEIGGTAVAAAARALRVVHHRTFVERALPERVRRGTEYLIQLGRTPDEVIVRNGNVSYDWIELPAALVREIARFETGPVPEVLAAMRAEGLPVDAALVQKLIDWQMLVAS